MLSVARYRVSTVVVDSSAISANNLVVIKYLSFSMYKHW